MTSFEVKGLAENTELMTWENRVTKYHPNSRPGRIGSNLEDGNQFCGICDKIQLVLKVYGFLFGTIPKGDSLGFHGQG